MNRSPISLQMSESNHRSSATLALPRWEQLAGMQQHEMISTLATMLSRRLTSQRQLSTSLKQQEVRNEATP